ncbi:hypothetical protein COU80_05600 [Candidatus Peregrinibacteria bacterium CG10_big_fil_rev_8_21_14_0_10_55_24]|nr:MAG: hypothetical protein COU80_05600 [Candidatus Peregrinibacteria bacterium CG10_big_fil_rev_8_21_14_0_10_55_24]
MSVRGSAWILFAALLFLPCVTSAAYPALTLQYRHFLFTVDPDQYPEWHASTEVWTYQNVPIAPLPSFRVDGDTVPPLPDGVTKQVIPGWNRDAIRTVLAQQVGEVLQRDAGSVTIRRDAEGTILFDGVGMLGRTLNLDVAVDLVIAALEQGISTVILPVEEQQPLVRVEDDELTSLGIREVVAIGESDFSGSPSARQHNIGVGLSRFNGHLIPQGEEFSFNEVLGPVNSSTGYRQELVILGERTLPDFGGGLCQVSTTAYRGVWEYGFPIEDRRNHSYVVRYYSPQGTDATIYPPHTDMRFLNDGPSALLIQTHHDEQGHAYFLYYGTRDSRTAQIIGPYTWGHTDPPPDRTEYTTEIPPGTTRKVGERVPGMRAAWYRIVQSPLAAEEKVEPVYSAYEARPRFTQIGAVSDVQPCTSLICP